MRTLHHSTSHERIEPACLAGSRDANASARPQLDPVHITRAVADICEAASSLDPEVQNRAAEALKMIYQQYAAHLRRTAVRTLQSQADAEDVLHDVFLRLPKKLPQYQGRGLGAWLRQMTRNEALTKLRRARSRREQPLASDAEIADAEQTLAEDQSEINGALRRLDPLQRDVVVLRYFLGFSHQTIAQTLSISSSASEVRLCRALKQLRLLLATTSCRTARNRTGEAELSESNVRCAAS